MIQVATSILTEKTSIEVAKKLGTYLDKQTKKYLKFKFEMLHKDGNGSVSPFELAAGRKNLKNDIKYIH